MSEPSKPQGEDRTDAGLLAGYLAGGPLAAAAFERLAAVHGGMVHQVCLRVLGRPELAEDASQAVFLVLARRAGSVRGDVGAFLHGVARNVARYALQVERARRSREKEAADMMVARRSGPEAEARWEQVRPHLDAAVGSLPAGERSAVVMYYLEGRPQAEVARSLGVPEGTVASRLSRALERMRGFLRKRGAGLSAAALPAMLAAQAGPAAPPPALLAAAGKLALAGAGSAAAGANAAALAKGAMHMIFWAKVKLAAAVVGAVLAVGGGGGIVAVKLAAGEPARVEVKPAGQVSLDTRWWCEHEFVWRLAEAAGLRWAITDGISSRGRAGGENVPAAAVAEEFEKATGIKCEVLGGVLVAHRPNDAKRKELEAKLAAAPDEAVRAAWLLGYLKDANAWPALARAACGKDAAVALSAAHALRRLDGEENFNIRRWMPNREKIYGGEWYDQGVVDAGLSQVPLGACFKDPVTAADLEALAKSPYVALREAAARIAASSGSGKALADKLAQDGSLYVRQAAVRTQRAWQAPGAAKPRPTQKPDLAKARADALKAPAGYPPEPWGNILATYGTDEDLKKLVETCSNTAVDGHIRYGMRYLLPYNAGGPAVAELYRKYAALNPWEDYGVAGIGRYGLTTLFDGENLAKELGPTLGSESWGFSSELVVARLSGPPILPALQKILTKRSHVAPLAVGYIGGPDAVRMIEPLLAAEDLGAATAAARGLGESGQLSAVAPLVKALASPNRVVRSRAALGLGRIGGPEAAEALAALLKTEKEYLPKRSACAMLKEIATGDPAHADAVAATEKELAEFVPAFNPVNPKLGADFPTGKLVKLGEVLTVASVGETRCAVDQYSGLWMRYGGCSGCYSNECTAFDVASGKWFVVRPPEMMGFFYNETRAAHGCSRGMAFEPRSRKFWINHAVGGGTYPANSAIMGCSACNYDATLDRFEAGFTDRRRGGEGPTFYVADSNRGLIVSEWMGPSTLAVDTATTKLVDLKFEGAPDLPFNSTKDDAAYDPVSGQILRTTGGGAYTKPEMKGLLWLFDVGAGQCRKSKAGIPEGSPENAMPMAYDSLNREVVLLHSTAAWRYDREKDEWAKAAAGDFQVYIVDYDAQHNVFLGLWNYNLCAFRLKNVPAGTKAFYGEAKPVPGQK
jgi:RNA polymerase sigma factor (sigma-70 family)